MKFSMTGQEKGDLLIQVTAWAGLTVHVFYIHTICVTDDQGKVTFVIVIVMSFFPLS